MATIKIYFDTRKSKSKEQKSAVKISINHRSSTSYLLLGISILPSQWDAKRLRVKDHPNKVQLNALLTKKYADAEQALLNLTMTGEVNKMTAPQVKAHIERVLAGITIEQQNAMKASHDTFSKWYLRFMNRKTDRTKEIYEATYKHLEKWLGKSKLEKLLFEQIKISWIEDFIDYLSETCSCNTIAIHLRNIRAVFNYAIDNEITTNYPFRRFKIKNEPTRKRNFDVDTLRDIFDAEVEPWMERYRDFFKLSFMLIGINTKDLCHLKDICNGRAEYIRSKTHKKYSIYIHPEAIEIIEKYKGENQLLNYLDTIKNYRSFNSRLVYGLKKMKELINQDREHKIDTLTMYWARHSWATIAARLDIPKDTIAAALGHGGHTVTDIYIEFDMSKVDDANRKVLDYVLYGKDYRTEQRPKFFKEVS